MTTFKANITGKDPKKLFVDAPTYVVGEPPIRSADLLPTPGSLASWVTSSSIAEALRGCRATALF